MEGNNKRSSSPVTRVYSELQRILTPNQCDQIFPLINSAVGSHDMNDEEIARQHQERLYDENLMDVDEPSVAAAAALTSLDLRRLEEIDADAAFARRLQEEEYSKHSMIPSRSKNEHFPPSIIDPNEGPIFTDAELAAQLQEDENKKQQRQRSRPVVPSQRRIPPPTTYRPNEPEVIPFPFRVRPTHQHPPSNANNNRGGINDFAAMLQLLIPQGRQTPGSRGIQNLQNTEGDFGPNDYDNLLELDNANGNKALTPEQINQLPTEKFSRPKNKTDEENKCNICWDQFEQNQTLRRLSCLHLYHRDCIDPWLKINNQCPICRIPSIK